MSIEFSLSTTTEGDDRGLGHLAGCLEIGDEFFHVAGGGVVTVITPGRVAEVHDCVLSCVTEETGGGQFCYRVARRNSFEV